MQDNSLPQGAAYVAPYRYAAAVEYAGAAYHGWQKQLHDQVPCIQACVESALSTIANHKVDVICAGRTDAASVLVGKSSILILRFNGQSAHG